MHAPEGSRCRAPRTPHPRRRRNRGLPNLLHPQVLTIALVADHVTGVTENLRARKLYALLNDEDIRKAPHWARLTDLVSARPRSAYDSASAGSQARRRARTRRAAALGAERSSWAVVDRGVRSPRRRRSSHEGRGQEAITRSHRACDDEGARRGGSARSEDFSRLGNRHRGRRARRDGTAVSA